MFSGPNSIGFVWVECTGANTVYAVFSHFCFAMSVLLATSVTLWYLL